LFLPSVATDHGWEVRRFLNQVCVKAGLHPTAWLDDATALYTFEGQVLRGRVKDAEGAIAKAPGRVCSAEDLRRYADFCCNNIGALMSGATPSFYAFAIPDGTVAGAILTLERSAPGERESAHFCHLSLRPGVPLQSTLFGLCQSAAKMLSSSWMANGAAPGIEVGVTILHDPTLHGTVGEPDLTGIDPANRAILVAERNKTGIVFDPTRKPSELLAEAARQAKVTHPTGAAVFSLDALAQAPVMLSMAPQPERGSAIRQPAVAGRFYPAEPAALKNVLDELLTGQRDPQAWPAAMVPHAGYQYSGRIAADVFKRLKIPRTVIILGPKHTTLGVEWAVAPQETWALPGGRLHSDVALAQQLCDAIPGLEMDAAAHQREHGIEVELPFIARLAPETHVVGIAVGAGDLASCQRFAGGLAEVIKNQEEPPLLLISSDMNHFASDGENRRLDALALAALERLDPANVYEIVTENQISMCGMLPAVIVLETLKLLGGLNKAERVAYATSADVTGDTSRVVGYAGMLFA
jgi:AmmeMemoRadiSam system protein B